MNWTAKINTFGTKHDMGRTAAIVTMGTVRGASPQARYTSRHGRGVVVAVRLTDLRGPAHGMVELPIWLFWHPDRTFDLDEPGMVLWMYQVVLREASSRDLCCLNGDLLIALWPDLYLPRDVRQAWEDQHSELHAASVPAA